MVLLGRTVLPAAILSSVVNETTSLWIFFILFLRIICFISGISRTDVHLLAAVSANRPSEKDQRGREVPLKVPHVVILLYDFFLNKSNE